MYHHKFSFTNFSFDTGQGSIWLDLKEACKISFGFTYYDEQSLWMVMILLMFLRTSWTWIMVVNRRKWSSRNRRKKRIVLSHIDQSQIYLQVWSPKPWRPASTSSSCVRMPQLSFFKRTSFFLRGKSPSLQGKGVNLQSNIESSKSMSQKGKGTGDILDNNPDDLSWCWKLASIESPPGNPPAIPTRTVDNQTGKWTGPFTKTYLLGCLSSAKQKI